MAARQERAAPLDQATVDAALADLDELRDLLQRGSRGDLDPDQVLDALRAYWGDHGPLLRRVGASVGELVRLQALSALYNWRDQLDAQLRAREAGTTRSSD